MGTNSVVLRCDSREHALALSVRDVRLLDGRFFAPPEAVGVRALLGLDFVKGLGAPVLNRVLVTHDRTALVSRLEALLSGFAAQRDLLSYAYRFSFAGRPNFSGSGRVSGFRVKALVGAISTRPSGYCDLTLSEIGPPVHSRVVETLDMRRQRELATDDWGLLKVSRRRAQVGWYTELPAALEWLEAQPARAVEILHR